MPLLNWATAAIGKRKTSESQSTLAMLPPSDPERERTVYALSLLKNWLNFDEDQDITALASESQLHQTLQRLILIGADAVAVFVKYLLSNTMSTAALSAALSDFVKKNPHSIGFFYSIPPELLQEVILNNPASFILLSSFAQNQFLDGLSCQQVYFFTVHVMAIMRTSFGDDGFKTPELSGLKDTANIAQINQYLTASLPQFTDGRNVLKQLFSYHSAKLITCLHNDQAVQAEQIISQFSSSDSPIFSDYLQELRTEAVKPGFSSHIWQELLSRHSVHNLFSHPALTQTLMDSFLALHGELFQLFSVGIKLTNSELENFKNTGELPLILDSSERQIEFINKRIQKIHNGHTPGSGKLGREITQLLALYHSTEHCHLHLASRMKIAATQIYQQYIVDAGLHKAQNDSAPMFDLQGNVLVIVSLSTDEMKKILHQFLGTEFPIKEPLVELAAYLGLPNLSDAIFCKLDISKEPILYERYQQFYADLSPILTNAMSKKQHHSIIPIMEEMICHGSLYLRAILQTQRTASAVDNAPALEPTAALYDDCYHRIHKYVAANLVTLRGKDDIVALNTQLDKLRPILAQNVRSMMANFLVEKGILQAQKIQSATKAALVSTTATGMYYLHTDTGNENLCLISATNNTAHSKGLQKVAARLILRSQYSPKEGKYHVFPARQPYAEIRVPSIAVLDAPEKQITADVVAKLGTLISMLKKRTGGYHGPFIYNLLTSLHTALWDLTGDKGNHQRASAEYILRGAHIHNSLQVKKGQMHDFIFIQNIPVNQHTNELTENSFDDVTAEASIMTTMALLALLNDYRLEFPPELAEDIGKTYRGCQQYYCQFLPTDFCFYKDSPSGKAMIAGMPALKDRWRTTSYHWHPTSWEGILAHTLWRLFITNTYRKKEFGMFTQALSIALTKCPISGCKSANERYQATVGRAFVLKALGTMSKDALSEVNKDLYEELISVANGLGTFRLLVQKMDRAFNDCLYSEVNFSLEDQGASAKIQCIDNHGQQSWIGSIFSHFNTNKFETPQLTHLAQKYAKGMQAHKL